MRLGGPQSRSGRCGEDRILDPTRTQIPTPQVIQPRSQALYRLLSRGSDISLG
jgi:hypothetical protein